MEWYQQPLTAVINYFKTDSERGLTQEQAQTALAFYGRNKIDLQIKETFLSIFIEQFKDPLVYLLIGSGAIIFLAGSRLDAFIIVGILLLNAIVGTVQESRITLMVDKLRSFKKGFALVIREGKKEAVADELLVPGDIVLVQEGERIPADGRLIESYNLTVNESILTGESNGVLKYTDVLTQEVPLTAQHNMVFAGSFVLTGYARVVVTATGRATQSGLLNKIIETSATEFPLQKDLERLLKFILWSIVGICVALLMIGVVTGKPFGQLLAALVALFICVVPQGVPMIMTLILVTNAHKLAYQKVLAKRLPALEALGRADVVVIDKTGTLTRNELMVAEFFCDGVTYTVTGSGYLPEGQVLHDNQPSVWDNASEQMKLLMKAVLLLDRSKVVLTPTTNTSIVKGNPSEAALRICAQKLGIPDDAVKDFYELYEIPFSAAYQYHAGFYNHNGQGVMFCIGSPEVIKQRSLDWKKSDDQQVQTMMQSGLRVLAVGYKTFSFDQIPENKKDFPRFFSGVFDNKITFLGAFGIHDALRPVAQTVVQSLQDAGLTVVMATGDSVDTASYLAQKAMILTDKQAVIDGPHMQRLSDEQLQQKVSSLQVYARVLPDDKVRIIRALQASGKTVMMVGDGVNDAPSMAVSQLGVVMGGAGSEVAKEAADIILLDDALEQLVKGVAYGRHIFYSFKRVVMYFFTSNFSEILVMLFGLAGNFPVPLLAAHILWLNLVTDGFLDAALAMELPEKNLLSKRWFTEQKELVDASFVIRVFSMALVCSAITFGVFWYYYQADLALARTMAVTMLTALECVNAVNMRSLASSAFTRSPKDNWWLMASLGLVVTLLLGILYVPWLQYVFQTVPLQAQHWGIIGAFCVGFFMLEEAKKIVINRFL